MIRNASLYLPFDDIDISDMFSDVSTDKQPFKEATYFEFLEENQTVRLNVMVEEEIQHHLLCLSSYIEFKWDAEAFRLTSDLFPKIKTVLGLVVENGFSLDSPLSLALQKIVFKYGGFSLMRDNLILSDGRVFSGHVKELV